MKSGRHKYQASRKAIDSVVRALRIAVTGKMWVDEPVARLVSFRVGGPAAILVEPVDSEDLARVGEVLFAHDLDALVVGRGTNLLVSDHGFSGVVIRLGKGFDWIRSSGEVVEAGGATPLPKVANSAARLSLTGLEFAIAIPAAVGGAVRMNAGAHGSAVSDVIESALICDLETGTLSTMGRDALRMAYRKTGIGPREVVCSARFRLSRGNPSEISSLMRGYRTHRSETQPVDAPNAGSMFRNPPGDSAGRLIEAAGLKGYRVGAAEVSIKHANFFLAHPRASAQQIYDLMATVQKTVLDQTGVLLVPEVMIAGQFDRSAGLRFDE